MQPHEIAELDDEVAGRASLAEILESVCDEVADPEPYTPTGLRRLDMLLDGGIRKGEVFLAASRPGVGKSAFALQVILSVARAGIPVALWSLEMRPKQWVRRAISALSGVQLRRIRMGCLNQVEEKLFIEAAGEILKLPIHFAKDECVTPATFPGEAAFHVRERNCGLLVIDYLQLMKPSERMGSREQEVAELSRMIKLQANHTEVPILMLAQLNRNADNRVPVLSDLRESGALEQDADEVFLIHRKRDESTHVLSAEGSAILAKNRDGETGSFPVMFNSTRFRFDAMEHE